MDTRTLVAFALMILIYFVFVLPTTMQPPSEPEEEVEEQEQSEDQAQRDREEPPQQAEVVESDESESSPRDEWTEELREQDLTLSNSQLRLGLNQLGEVLSIELPHYAQSSDDEEPMRWQFERFNEQKLRTTEGLPHWRLEEKEDSRILLSSVRNGLEFRREIKLRPESYVLEFRDWVRNLEEEGVETDLDIIFRHPKKEDDETPSTFRRILVPQTDFLQVAWFQDGNLEHKAFGEVSTTPQEESEALSFSGYASKYFFLGAVPQNVSLRELRFFLTETDEVRQELSFSRRYLAPGEDLEYRYALYLGPKKMPELEKLSSELTRVIDYGNWIGPISRALLSVLLFFYQWIPNYGIAIILLTLMVKLALFPLTYKSAVSMRKLQVVAPKMKEIRDKYKNDKHRMNAEMMALYRTEKVNPLGGCLPIVLQMPIFFALYRVFFTSIEMRHAPFFGWIQDLSSHDPFFVTPILMVLLMWSQQKLMPTPTAGQDNSEMVQIQKAMLRWMPLIFGAIMLFLPSGLTLYFLTNAFFSVVQQLYLNRRLRHMIPDQAPSTETS